MRTTIQIAAHRTLETSNWRARQARGGLADDSRTERNSTLNGVKGAQRANQSKHSEHRPQEHPPIRRSKRSTAPKPLFGAPRLAFLLLVTLLAPSAEAAAPHLLYARPFVAEEGIPFWIGGEIREARAGHVLVIEVDPAVLAPTNAPGRNLFLGDGAVRKVNLGVETGRLVILTPARDLAEAPVWLSEPALLRRLDAQAVAAGRNRAGGASALKSAEIETALEASREKGSGPLQVRDMDELYREAARLVLEYVPAERSRAESYLFAEPRSAD